MPFTFLKIYNFHLYDFFTKKMILIFFFYFKSKRYNFHLKGRHSGIKVTGHHISCAYSPAK